MTDPVEDLDAADENEPGTRYDPAPLLALFDDLTAASERLGVTPRSLMRWRDTGLPYWKADRMAYAAGFHPSELWPTWWDDALAEDDGHEITQQTTLFRLGGAA